MKLKLVGLALIPALLSSTAVFAQDDTHPYFGLSATAGAAVIAMPGAPDGVLLNGKSQSNNPIAIGGTLGISGSVGIGKLGDYDAALGLNAFATYGVGNSTSTQSFSGVGIVTLPGFTTPADGTMTLATGRGALSGTASNSVVDSGPGGTNGAVVGGSSTVAGTGQSGSGTQEGTNEFTFQGANTSVSAGGDGSALSWGAIANDTGSIFIAVGDLDGLKITQKAHQSIIYTGADITFSLSGNYDAATNIQVFAGPSYRYLGQHSSNSLSVDLPEYPGSNVVHPTYSLDSKVEMVSNYLGGVLGMGVSHQLENGVVLSASGEGSLYYTNSFGHGTDTASISGGTGVGPYVGHDVSVDGPGGAASIGGLAYAVRGEAGVTMPLTPSLDLSLTGNVDYLSKVAHANTGSAGVTYTETGSTADASYTPGSAATPFISFGDMFSFGGKVSLIGHF